MDLGIFQSLCASALYLSVFDAGFGGPLDSRIDRARAAKCDAWVLLGTPQGERLPQKTYFGIFENSRSWQPTRYPALHSKATPTRHCVPGLRLVLDKLTQAANEFDALRELFTCLTTLYDVLRNADMRLPHRWCMRGP